LFVFVLVVDSVIQCSASIAEVQSIHTPVVITITLDGLTTPVANCVVFIAVFASNFAVLDVSVVVVFAVTNNFNAADGAFERVHFCRAFESFCREFDAFIAKVHSVLTPAVITLDGLTTPVADGAFERVHFCREFESFCRHWDFSGAILLPTTSQKKQSDLFWVKKTRLICVTTETKNKTKLHY